MIHSQDKSQMCYWFGLGGESRGDLYMIILPRATPWPASLGAWLAAARVLRCCGRGRGRRGLCQACRARLPGLPPGTAPLLRPGWCVPARKGSRSVSSFRVYPWSWTEQL